MAKSRPFLMSRPGLRDGCQIPLRLHLLDTAGLLIDITWRVLAFVLTFQLVKAQGQAGLLPHPMTAFLFLLGYLIALWWWGTPLVLAVVRWLAIAIGIVTPAEAVFFPVSCDNSVAAPWPLEWQHPIDTSQVAER